MFQTFTGSSRRPRQVNLSGRNNNPFAAVQQTSAARGSLPTAVVNAQQERKARQYERERLQAAKVLQKSWRGHRCRKGLREEARRQWDEQEQILTQRPKFDSPGNPPTAHQAL